MNNTTTSAAKDFGRKAVTTLSRKGIRITGSTWLPGTDGSFANGERGYLLDDNGTGKARTYAEMRSLIAGCGA